MMWFSILKDTDRFGNDEHVWGGMFDEELHAIVASEETFNVWKRKLYENMRKLRKQMLAMHLSDEKMKEFEELHGETWDWIDEFVQDIEYSGILEPFGRKEDDELD